MSKNIKVVSFDDWELLFIDDKLVWQHHSLDVEQLDSFLNLGIEFHNYNMTGIENYLYEAGEVDGKITWDEFLKLAKEQENHPKPRY